MSSLDTCGMCGEEHVDQCPYYTGRTITFDAYLACDKDGHVVFEDGNQPWSKTLLDRVMHWPERTMVTVTVHEQRNQDDAEMIERAVLEAQKAEET